MGTKNDISYEVKESTRARSLRITIDPTGSVLVTKPKRVSYDALRRFVESKRAWIEKVLSRCKETLGAAYLPRPRRGSVAYIQAKEEARVLVTAKLAEWNAHYGFEYKKVFIRDTKTRWGTCSKAGNLGFNYRILYLPSHLADYVIVHEICHLKEFNHKKAFWDLIAETIPEHKAVRKELRFRYLF